jgi:hypothetical protein
LRDVPPLAPALVPRKNLQARSVALALQVDKDERSTHMIQARVGFRSTVAAMSAVIILCWAGSDTHARAADGSSPEPEPSDPRREMIAALAAPGPHPSLGAEATAFDRFVGTWDCDYSFHAEDGSVRRSAGELRFGWIIDGRAVQDIWIGYPKESSGERTIGTSVRFFDAKSRTWRVVFVAPTFGLLTVRGGVEGDRIVFRGQDVDGGLLRWSFNDIKSDSFTWRGEKSRDGGRTWRLEEEHHMKRRTRS